MNLTQGYETKDGEKSIIVERLNFNAFLETILAKQFKAQ